MIDAERGGATAPEGDGFLADVQPRPATAYSAHDIRQRSARTTANVEEMMRRREPKSVDVAAKLSRGHPRVLADVFAVRFASDAPHQRRVELVVDGVIRPVTHFVVHAHTGLFAGKLGRRRRRWFGSGEYVPSGGEGQRCIATMGRGQFDLRH